MEKNKNSLTPLILDLAEIIDVIYDEQGEQVGFGGTTIGTFNEIDSGGTD